MVDLRLGWRPCQNLEFSIVGQNLWDDQHPEFGAAPTRQENSSERFRKGGMALLGGMGGEDWLGASENNIATTKRPRELSCRRKRVGVNLAVLVSLCLAMRANGADLTLATRIKAGFSVSFFTNSPSGLSRRFPSGIRPWSLGFLAVTRSDLFWRRPSKMKPCAGTPSRWNVTGP